MNPVEPPKHGHFIRKRYVVLLVFLLLVLLLVVGVTGFFRLSPPTLALRNSVFNAHIGQWQKKVAVHVGPLTLATARLVTRLVKMPPEALAALSALHGGEVGVYKLDKEPVKVDSQSILNSADNELTKRGWMRVVGVAQERELVAIYIPEKNVTASHIKCCVLVLSGRDLVVVSANGNLEPIMEIASSRLNLHKRIQQLANSTPSVPVVSDDWVSDHRTVSVQ